MNQRILCGAVMILLLASFLRFHLLEAQSFWNDEGNSARLSERSVSAILEGTASDIHPPLYYLLLRGWRELAGESEFGLRSFSAFAGVLTVALTLALARRLSRRPAMPALMAAFLAAASPVLVYYNQETRMYALLAVLALASTWVLVVWLGDRLVERSAWTPAVVYTLLSAAGLYTHYFYPAVIIAQALLVVTSLASRGWLWPDVPGTTVRPRRREFVLWLGMVLLALVFYLPWLPVFLRQIGGRQGARPDLAGFLAPTGRWLALGSTVRAGELSWTLAAAAVLLVLGLVAGRRRALAPMIMATIPLILIYLVGATDPAFLKFILLAVPFLCVVAGLAWRLPGAARLVPALLTALILLGFAHSLNNMYGDPAFARADYRGIAELIETESFPNAAVLLNAPNQWEVFTYYHRHGASVYPLPRGRADAAVILPELETIAAAHERIYALFWGERQRDPEGIIETWLDANTFKAREEWVGDVRLAIYAVPGTPAGEPTSSDARFRAANGDLLRLREYQVSPLSGQPGEVVQVRLLWDSAAQPRQGYKVFLHLLDGDGNIIAQRDGEPAGGSRPTTTWQPDEIVVDNHGVVLPSDSPPGEYELRVGLYDQFDPAARLAVEQPGGLTGDTLHLATIRLDP